MTVPEYPMRKILYFVMFLIALETLALETTLTRIFSVTMWYHYAFMAISIAMLGMSTGAVKVYLAGYGQLEDEKIYDKISGYSVVFGFSVLISILTLLSIPFVPRNSGVGIFSMALIYVVAAVPFYFSGIVISLILATKFISNVNRLYAADLAGAAIGAVLFYLFLSIIDAVTFIFLLSTFSFIAAYALKKQRRMLVLITLLLVLTAANHNYRIFRVEWSKVETGVMAAEITPNIEWEKWTPFSRITVMPFLDRAFGWGISEKLKTEHPEYRVGQKSLVIDAAAATIITGKEKPIPELLHLSYDITNLAHYIVRDARVAVIGVGGGRDILSALHFNQKEVYGIEINGRIIEADLKQYKDFTYPFAQFNNVHIVNDEARSFIERSDLKFDIIQASLIDSWAATASGAFVLTENSLYSVEGWKAFLSKLSDRGVVTMSRWYYKKRPGELLRLASLAYESLRAYGIEDPSKHIMLAATTFSGEGTDKEEVYGTGTIIVSKKPFDGNAVNKLLTTSERYGFQVLIAAGYEGESIFQQIVQKDKRDAVIANYPLNLKAPTDDSPFFFNMLRPLSFIKYKNIDTEGPLATNLKAITNLLWLFVIVIILSCGLIIFPVLARMKGSFTEVVFNPLTLYFAAIGMGFMLIEVALIQKFTVFLGHPTYSLIVVLFTILLFTGLGSYISGRLKERMSGVWPFVILLCVICAAGGVNMFILPLLSSSALAFRIFYSFITLAVIGTVLGMPFPAGMSAIPDGRKEWGAWLWGINGAMGVVSSVLATIISIFLGISVTFFTGVFAYIIAMTAFLLIKKTAKA